MDVGENIVISDFAFIFVILLVLLSKIFTENTIKHNFK